MRKVKDIDEMLEDVSASATALEHPEIEAREPQPLLSNLTSGPAPAEAPADRVGESPSLEATEEPRGKRHRVRSAAIILCATGLVVSAVAISRRRESRQARIRRFIREAGERARRS